MRNLYHFEVKLYPGFNHIKANVRARRKHEAMAMLRRDVEGFACGSKVFVKRLRPKKIRRAEKPIRARNRA